MNLMAVRTAALIAFGVIVTVLAYPPSWLGGLGAAMAALRHSTR
jgi:hypothetical protein